MLVAFSCESFKKVSNEDYVYRNERKKLDFYEHEDPIKSKKNRSIGTYDSFEEI